MKKITLIIVLVAVFTLAISISPVSACYDCGPGVGTPGYWKNHPDAWPVDTIIVGSLAYSKADALDWLNQPVKGDKSITLFKAYVATYLNLAAGNCDECIMGWFYKAAEWLEENPVGSGVKADSEAWQCNGEYIYTRLDWYNNGGWCAAPRD